MRHVKLRSPVKHDGKKRAVGFVITNLDDEAAARLVALGVADYEDDILVDDPPDDDADDVDAPPAGEGGDQPEACGEAGTPAGGGQPSPDDSDPEASFGPPLATDDASDDADIQSMTKAQLTAALIDVGVKPTGKENKAELAKMLAEAWSTPAEAGTS